ncbi:MAG: phosphoribosylanthranilate isomerase [Gammaproteobacteria bacterium]|nr:phosphoribosylanthranilate isomerase [Gammaproteobacteria bacterium]
MRTRVKICGITGPADARTAVAAGADAVGVVVYEPSPRTASIDQAPAIRDAVPAFVSLVLVTVDLEGRFHRRWIEALAPDLLQFHGSESPELCAQFGLPYIKSLRIRDNVDIAGYEARYPQARALLLDTWVPGVAGGTGRRFDWALARRCRTLPVILAGGLDASVVGEAIRQAEPYAVDVSSSLESAPGVKDHRLVHEFMRAVRDADAARADRAP